MTRSAAGCDVFHAIADPTRRRLLDLLKDGEKSVMALVGAFRVRQPTISRHLRVLREAGLVSIREQGRLRLYRLNAQGLRAAGLWLVSYEPFWDQKLDALGQYLERQHSQPRAALRERSSDHGRKHS